MNVNTGTKDYISNTQRVYALFGIKYTTNRSNFKMFITFDLYVYKGT
jgi:hypothetical protein